MVIHPSRAPEINRKPANEEIASSRSYLLEVFLFEEAKFRLPHDVGKREGM